MPIIPIDSILDPRIDAYRDLKDRELAAMGGLFIAEGEHVTRRLLASDYPVESVLLAHRRVEELAPLVPESVPVFAAGDDVITGIMGFKFHSGVIGCGRRKPPETIDALMRRIDASAPDQPVTLMICPEIINHDNLGSMIRICAAFGVDALILGERSCDPFWRRSIRVSMGTIFRLPILQSADNYRDITTLQKSHGFELLATVLDPDAQSLETVVRSPRVGLLLGSESQGLPRRWIEACDRRITIPMQLGTDSLNVSVAAGVFLYHLTRGMKE